MQSKISKAIAEEKVVLVGNARRERERERELGHGVDHDYDDDDNRVFVLRYVRCPHRLLSRNFTIGLMIGAIISSRTHLSFQVATSNMTSEQPPLFGKKILDESEQQQY